jgi:methionine-gamma-lyase
MKFKSRVVHGVPGAERMHKESEGAHVPPIYQTSTFLFDDVAHGARAFSSPDHAGAHIYTRISNPNNNTLEQSITSLECYDLDSDGYTSMVFGTGMAAISTAIMAIAKQGQVLAQDALYGCSSQLLFEQAPHWGIEANFIDFTDVQAFQEKVQSMDNLKVVYMETITNPTMRVAQMDRIIGIAHEAGAKVIVDNTFASPVFCRPLNFGADIVIHSTTKYIGGHGTSLGGVLTCSKELAENYHLGTYRKNLGGIAGPMDSWLLNNGLKTMALRVQAQTDNAMKVAQFLESHDSVKQVWYPMLESHPDFNVAQSILLGGAASVMSFELKGGFEAGTHLMNSVQLCSLAVSLGAVDTLIQHPASMTHSVMDAHLRQKAGIEDGLVRLAVGIEDVDDIIGDLNQALENVFKSS